ncbi:conserved hypothetical protein [Candidatus Propionivibrio aalborgensis]|uniref:Uncharacterized protein n=1 Tax=Candidatus Propionivibrio aalborgensis TaxID=1860101 RepID=A0A1A8XJM1_9RHOO|nr:conserved hypothetical protein [Candidatus Propionivibrio aalborgensis]
MGGYGSGRRSGKSTTDDMLALDVRRLQRDGMLTPGRASSRSWSRRGTEVATIQVRAAADRVTLDYRSRSNGGDWQQVEYPVYLEWTACNLGGRRAWFLCPTKGCGRRVAILFGSSVFACRHCHKLAYQCQRETDGGRAMGRADNIRRRLGWPAGIANPLGGKPKGMHWRTYTTLLSQYHTFASASWEDTAQRLGLMRQRLGSVHDALKGEG